MSISQLSAFHDLEVQNYYDNRFKPPCNQSVDEEDTRPRKRARLYAALIERTDFDPRCYIVSRICGSLRIPEDFSLKNLKEITTYV